MAAVVAQTTTSLAPKHPAMQRAQARREDQHEQRPDLVYARLGTPYGVTSLRRPPASRAAALAGGRSPRLRLGQWPARRGQRAMLQQHFNSRFFSLPAAMSPLANIKNDHENSRRQSGHQSQI